MSSDTLLSEHVREEIEHWKARFPEDRQRSAVIGALHAAQHDNDGFLTPELMDAVAEYLGLPNIQVYEVATFYSMFQTKPVGRNNGSAVPTISSNTSRTSLVSSSAKARKTAGSISSVRRSAWQLAVVHR
jgi:NADH-quinone oxidoreductase subunit E